MTIGGSIALIVIGAILRFAVTLTIGGINIQLIGVILMIGGVLGLVIALVFLARRRRPVTTTAGTPAQVYEERRYTEPPV